MPGDPRILMTADAVGGVWRYSVDLGRKLTAAGAEVLLAVMGPAPREQQRHEVKAVRAMELAEGPFALEWMDNPWNEVDAAGEWLLNLASSFKPDVIHLNGYAHASLKWRRPVVVVAHSCVCSWWRAVHGEEPGPEWAEYKRRVKAGLEAADRVVAVSRFMAGALEREYGVTAGKAEVIANFSGGRMNSRPEKQPFFLAAGRFWDGAKNLQLLERISPRLDWAVRIAGGGQAHSLGHLEHDDLRREMEMASVFVHPALYEPFGLAVLEAAQAGCCLALADIPSLREMWDGAALFMDPRDAGQWNAALNMLSADAKRRARLGEQAQERAARYDAATTVEKYRKVYRSLIETSKGAAA